VTLVVWKLGTALGAWVSAGAVELSFIQLKLACPPVLGLELIARRKTCVPAFRVPRLLVMVRQFWKEPVLGMMMLPPTFWPSSS
jgi:hypothetical protein